MENLIDILVGILGGAGIIFLLRLFRPKPSDKNKEVKIEVSKIDEENKKINDEIQKVFNNVMKEIDKLEKQKNEKPKNNQELADFFNNRKSDK
jgi:predicted transcriptional regulator